MSANDTSAAEHAIATVIQPHLKDPRRPGGKGSMVLAGDILTALEKLGWVRAGGHGPGRCEACGAAADDMVEHVLRCELVNR